MNRERRACQIARAHEDRRRPYALGVLTEEPTARGEGPTGPRGPARGRRVSAGRLLPVLALGVAALSLLWSAAPTYDPWAWIVWGREITQLDLQTVAGPSWKPLPVLFTTVFALFGDAAPALWVLVARVGYVAAVLLAFRVARRLGGGVAGGLAAAAALALAPWFLRNAGLGNSEPLLVALLLAAVDRHLSGDLRGAFLLGVGTGLLRPEAWPFLGLYGLWLLWRRHLGPRLVVGAGVATVALWTLPEWWGSGDPLRAMSRAQDPNPGAAAFADDPVRRILSDAEAMLVVPVEAALVAALVLVGWGWRRRGGGGPGRALAGVLALAVAWLAIVAVMTADGGFSGNQRYLVTPVALGIVAAGAGAGALLRRARVPATVAAVVLTALFAVASTSQLGRSVDAVRYQADLLADLGTVVEQAGGKEAVRACGRPYTGPFLVPAVAWHLGVHTEHVALRPRRPAVVFRVRTDAGARPVPSLRGLADGGAPPRTLATAPGWRIVAACGGGVRARHGILRGRDGRHRDPPARAPRLAPRPRALPAAGGHGGGPRAARRPLRRAAHAGDRREALDRRGPVGRDRVARPRRHPRAAAPGRLAAAVLPAAARLDRRGRRRRDAHARAEPALRRSRPCRSPSGRGVPCSARARHGPAPRSRRSTRS